MNNGTNFLNCRAVSHRVSLIHWFRTVCMMGMVARRRRNSFQLIFTDTWRISCVT